MPSYKRIGRSKYPLYPQTINIVSNLRKKYNKAVFLDCKSIDYNSFGGPVAEFRLSFVPGFSGEECTGEDYPTWSSLLDRYFELMKG